jgi:hypothetical protein
VNVKVTPGLLELRNLAVSGHLQFFGGERKRGRC